MKIPSLKLSPRYTLYASGIVAVLLVGGIATQQVYQHLKQTSPGVAAAAGEPLPVMVQTVEIGLVDQLVGAQAIAAEKQLVPIRTSLGTVRVRRVHVQLGEVVKAGRVLIEMDDTLQKAALDTARIQRDSYIQEVQQTGERLPKIQTLFSEGMATADELRKAMQDEAEARVKLSSSESRLVQANADHKATRILAPVNGIVTECDLNPGTVVRQGTDLMKLSEINPILVNAMMGEEKINYVHVGQQAEISFYAFPGRKFQGEVVIVKPSIEQKSRLVTAIIRVKNPQFEIKPGMNGMAQLQYRREALRVPGIALLSRKDGVAHVFAVDDEGIAHLRQVETGAASEGYVEVVDGLEPGDRVVVVGQAALSDKVRVRVGDKHAAHL